MKRYLSTVLVILMLVSVLAVPAAAVAPDLPVTLRLSETEPMAVGDTFTIAVEFGGTHTISSVDVRLVYNKEVLEIDTSGVEWAYETDSDNNETIKTVGGQSDARFGAIVWAARGTVEATEGAFVTIPFKIKAKPASGMTTEISLESRKVEGELNTYYNVVCDPVTVTIDHEHRTDENHHTPLEAASCTSAGHSAYYTCTVCGREFFDAAMTQEVKNNNEVLPALGHNMVHHERVEPTTETEGNIEYWYCTRCQSCYTTESGYNVEGTASTQIAQQDTVLPKKPSVLYGDVDGNGKVNAMDVVALKQFLAKPKIREDIDQTAADCDGNGKINAMDVVALKQFLAKPKIRETLGPSA